ncbi:MAG TPA: NUDIX hydrolase [Steroidobacteraceae bacterium]|nr:NUDIX hydrolase [Steroidobacteraceae bacterium]
MTRITSTLEYDGRVIRVSLDEVLLPNGRQALLEVVHHPGGAAAVAIDRDHRVCLLRQYRYVAGGWVWELPAGKLEPDEPPLATAQRELAEEAGLQARQWDSLGTILSSPGVFSEVLHIFLATDLEPVAAALEPNEVLEVHWVPFAEACERALSGELRDAKTALGLLRAARHRGARLATDV